MSTSAVLHAQLDICHALGIKRIYNIKTEKISEKFAENFADINSEAVFVKFEFITGFRCTMTSVLRR